MYWVYAIWSEAYGKIYVGYSHDVDNRVNEHNRGKSNYTKKYMPWHLFFTEEADTKEIALKKEIYYKSGWGRRRLKSILEKWQSRERPLDAT